MLNYIFFKREKAFLELKSKSDQNFGELQKELDILKNENTKLRENFEKKSCPYPKCDGKENTNQRKSCHIDLLSCPNWNNVFYKKKNSLKLLYQIYF